MLSEEILKSGITDCYSLCIIQNNIQCYTYLIKEGAEICFDGNKMCVGYDKTHGVVHLFGCEDVPTLNDK